jgi:hypothetical protein
MQVVILRDLNPKKGLVVGAIRDWPRPVITELERQIGDKDWYSFDAGMIRSIGRSSVKEHLRTPEPETPAIPPEIAEVDQRATAQANAEPGTTAEALVRDAGDTEPGLMVAALAQDSGELGRVQRGPQRRGR